jgi:hypothetical protein
VVALGSEADLRVEWLGRRGGLADVAHAYVLSAHIRPCHRARLDPLAPRAVLAGAPLLPRASLRRAAGRRNRRAAWMEGGE